MGTAIEGIGRGDKPALKLSDTERAASWSRFVTRCVEVSAELYDHGAVEEARLYQRALDGGACPRCGVEWETVRIDNALMMGTRYRPACTCYPDWTEVPIDKTGKITTTQAALEREVVLFCDRCGRPIRRKAGRRILNEEEVRKAIAPPRYERVVCPGGNGKCTRRSVTSGAAERKRTLKEGTDD